ncbi:MAG: FKBP-type peptidyl-prolyl cis-trans isomerase [Candidatus Altiarchaeota archaeon]
MGEEEKIPVDAVVAKKPRRKSGGRPKKVAVEEPEVVRESGEVSGSSCPVIPKHALLVAVVVLVAVAGLVYFSQNSGGPAGVIFYLTQYIGGPAGVTSTTVAPVDRNAVAADGDIVSVEYTGTFENGSVFDTSNKALAEKSGVYNPLRTYEPLQFTLGYGGLIKGFEEAVVGMKVDEEKTFTLPPEKAYGYPTEKMIETVLRSQKSPIMQNVSIEKFVEDVGLQPTLGLEFNIPNTTDYELNWPMRVLAVSDDTVTFKFLPNQKTTIQTVFGPAEVYGEGDEIIIQLNAKVGQKIVTLVGPAKVVGVNDENITLDFNHELAGKVLKFNVKILNILKQQ